MGNKVTSNVVKLHRFDLDRPDRTYFTDETISGRVSSENSTRTSIVLIGKAFWRKSNFRTLEFYRNEFPLKSSIKTNENFRFRLNENLPPSFHRFGIFPNVFYSINFVDRTSKSRVISSIPIRICPRLRIDRVLSFYPFLFGPIENNEFNLKLNVKINRAAFTFDDSIRFSYELKNSRRKQIDRIETNLSIVYRVETDVYQEKLADAMENRDKFRRTKSKRIRNENFLQIPTGFYLPPTFSQYFNEKIFETSVQYQIQIKIYFDESNLWQINVPIVIGHELTSYDKSTKRLFSSSL